MSQLIYNKFYQTKLSFSQFEICLYAMKVLLFNIISIVIILTTSLILNEIEYGFLFLLFFIPIRILIGGYHSKNPISCLCYFAILFILCNQFSQMINLTVTKILVFVLLIVLIFLKPIDVLNQKRHNSLIKCNVLKNIITLIYLILLIFNKKIIIESLCSAIIANTILYTIGYFLVKIDYYMIIPVEENHNYALR